MIVKKSNRITHKNSDKCIAYEYLTNDKDINVAYVEIDGRYPDKGRVVNTKCKEIGFVTEGTGKLVVEGNEQTLGAQDVFLILPNQKYYFEGKLKLVVPCTPAWHPEQHKYCE